MRFLMTMAAVVIIIAGAQSASAAPGSVTVDGRANGCASFSSCTSGVSNVKSEFFGAGTYEFTVASGAWNSFNYGTTDLNGRKWLWEMLIYQPSTGMTFSLGSSNAYGSANDALSNNAGAITPFITVSSQSGENLLFYVFDDVAPHENEGTITADITIVPEPVSTTLFLTGGMFLAGRGYLRKRKK